jgi:hypothetical protein
MMETTAADMYNNCLKHSGYFKKLNFHELEAVQELCRLRMGKYLNQAYDVYNTSKLPEIGGKGMGELFKGISKDMNILLNDPEFVQTLPEDFFKAQNLYRQVEGKIQGRKKEKSPQTFEDLFRDPENAGNVKSIFEIKGYTKNGAWQGLTDNKNELLAAYFAFKSLLKPHKITPTVKIIYNEFKLPAGYISERMMRQEPLNDLQVEFERIFEDLLN